MRSWGGSWAAVAVTGLLVALPVGTGAQQRSSVAKLGMVAAAKPADLIIEYDRLQNLRGNYQYRAFERRIVLRDNATQERAVVDVGDREEPVLPAFRALFATNPDLEERLGPALTAAEAVLGGRVRVQAFLGGAMLLEEESRVIWWGWHRKRSIQVRRAPVAAPPVAPAAPSSEVVDETGALTREEAVELVAALRAFRTRTGLALGMAFVGQMETEAARKRAQDLRASLVAAGVLPEVSALFMLEGSRSYLWQRDTRVDQRLSWDAVQAAWKRGPAAERLGARGLAFVRGLGDHLAGAPAPPVAPPPPVVTPPGAGMGGEGGLQPPDPPAIPVRRGLLLSEAQIAPTGGELKTADGLALRFPSGGVPQAQGVRVFSATVPAPPIRIRPIGEGEAADLTVLAAWDVDLPGRKGLLPEPVEVAIDLSRFQRADGRVPLPAPAETLDGRTWDFIPFEIRGSHLVFRTRHFSPKILGAHPVYWVALGAAAAGYVIYRRADELPSICGKDAPFVASKAKSLNDFEVYWSTKMPGVDPKTGLADEAGFTKALAEARKGGFVVQDTEMDELRRRYLMPPAARKVEEALVFAQEYLVRRGFKKPFCRLPVYITPTLGADDGALYNPWTGRRYILIGGNMDVRSTYRAALHELFHHFQIGYNWIFDGDSAFMEACATLIEREAGLDPAYQKKLVEAGADRAGLLNPGDNNAKFDVFRTGLAGPPYTRDPKPAQRHGYGLSWFLEYLRDQKNAANPAQFLPDLMANCSSYTAPDAFEWAAGGSDYYLARRYLAFAEDYLLKGMPSESPYGKLYFPAAAHQVWNDAHPAADTFDFAQARTRELGVGMKAWSIQTYRLLPPPGKAKLLVQCPAEWSAGNEKRGVFLRAAPRDVGVKDYRVMLQPGDGAVALPFTAERGVYLVDTGQASKQPLRLAVLEPPTGVKHESSGGVLRVSWTVPPAVVAWPDLFQGYRVYLTAAGEPRPAAVLDVPRPVDDFARNPAELDLAKLRVTPAQQQKGLVIEVTTVTKDGLVTVVGADGKKGPLESERSDPPAAPAGGTLTVVVHEPKPAQLPANPYEVLNGIPTPGAVVVVSYTHQGKPAQQRGVTDKQGRVRLTGIPVGVALKVEINVGTRREVKQATLAADKPAGVVEFGWMGHEVKPP
jgi:hypothetical protein